MEQDLKSIEKFSGERPGPTPVLLLKQLDDLRTRYKDLWTADEMDDTRLVVRVLSGDALSWWHFQYQFTTWEQFRRDFAQIWGPRREDLLHEYKNLYWSPPMDVRKYGATFIRLCQELDFKMDNVQLLHFVESIGHPIIKSRALVIPSLSAN